MERIDINVLYLLGLLRCVFRGTAAGSARAISTMIQNHLIISDYEPGTHRVTRYWKKQREAKRRGWKKEEGVIVPWLVIIFQPWCIFIICKYITMKRVATFLHLSLGRWLNDRLFFE